MPKWVLGILIITSCIFADDPETYLPQQHKSPEEIQEELDKAEKDFQDALKLFNPWYTGPIIAGGPSMVPPGMMNIQPYVYVVDNYASFNADGKSVHDSHPLWQFQVQPEVATGITSWMDIATGPMLTSNFRNEQSYTGQADLPIILGFKILKQGVWVPGIKVSVNESVPIGKYQHLSIKKLGTDATGSGSWVTTFTFRIGKLLFWWTRHPLNTRLFLGYSIPSTVRIRGLSSYGGGFGTRGKVRPGNRFVADLGLEWSLTQRWAIATDVLFATRARTKFNGNPGINPFTGLPAGVGGGSSYTFQLAPAIEYNWSPTLSAIGGVWFTPFGRNSGNFLIYVFSVSWLFSVT